MYKVGDLVRVIDSEKLHKVGRFIPINHQQYGLGFVDFERSMFEYCDTIHKVIAVDENDGTYKLSGCGERYFVEEWLDDNIDVIIDYHYFSIFWDKRKRCYRCCRTDNYECDVELRAELKYDFANDCYASSDFLHTMFDNDYCGEYINDDCIEYLWFKEIE